jgi:RNA polymerase sigma-70 factor (ECF subfamily)
MSTSANQDEFVRLLTSSRHALFGYIYSIVRSTSDAEDLFQQTSLLLWKKFDQYEADSNFLAWACAVARFEIRNFQVRDRRRQFYLSQEVQAELATIQSRQSLDSASARREALAACMTRLSQRDRSLVDRCYGGDEQIKDVASQLGRTARSLYDALNRIRRQLMDCVARRLQQEGIQ